jgi:Uma2 family endonuclease
VASSTTTRLTTFAEFDRLPNLKGGHHELHHGEVIEVSPPKHGHLRAQRRLWRLLEAAAGQAGEVEIEVGYRPVPEHEYWVADVVFVTRERWDQVPDTGNLQGAPELVIEVLSPSNTASEIRDKKKMCLENGSQEFWVVDRNQREVEVSTPDGHTVTYKSGQEIPLFFAPGAQINVDAIFS